MRKPPARPEISAQEELPLSSIKAHATFPGRTSLRVGEVAKVLEMTDEQVIDLIEEGKLMAVNIGSGLRSDTNPKGNKTPRRFWRIPVAEYDAFIDRNSNQNPT